MNERWVWRSSSLIVELVGFDGAAEAAGVGRSMVWDSCVFYRGVGKPDSWKDDWPRKAARCYREWERNLIIQRKLEV
jgi:hypothetical protein